MFPLPQNCVEILTPSTCDVTLFGNRGFADVNKLRGDHTGLRWTQNPVTDVLIRRRHRDTETEIHRHTEREDDHVKTGRNWSDVSAGQGIPRISGSHQKLGRGKKGLFPRVFRGNKALLTLNFHFISKLQNCERINLCCFKPPSLS